MTANDDSACWVDCKDRFRFETILTELSARFISMPADQVDAEIVEAQRQVCEHLGLDISVLWQQDLDAPEFLVMTHLYRPLGGPPVPERMLASESFPWAFAQVMAGRSFLVQSMDEIPEGAERDAEVWRHYGLVNALVFPLAAGGVTLGALSFHDVLKPREWPETLVKRLELVAAVLGNAILRKRSERALRESEERLQMATAAAGAGLWVLDAARTRFWVNAETMALLGLPPGDHIEVEHFLALVHADDRERVRETMAHALDTREMSTVEYRVVRADGSVRWLQSLGRPCVRAAGEPAQLMGLTADITGRRAAEEEMARLRRELAHVSRVYTAGELASSMAHELNQPLAAIVANADAAEIHARSPQPDLGEIQAILDDIRRDGLRAGDIIHRMRAFLQRREVERRSLDMEQLVRESVKFVEPDASTRKIAVRLQFEPGLPPGLGDRIQLQQVLLNLMVNGMDAMNGNTGGMRQLSVSAGRVAADRVEVSVGDTGHGLAPETLAEVFEPFFTTKRGGLGMGLAISRSIVEAHGGQLWLENNPEGGATARFTLPTAVDPEGRAP